MIKQKLQDKGYCVFSPPHTYSDDDIKIITSEFTHLEKDHYAPDKVKRFRRYANGIILPWKNNVTIEWLPIKEIDGKRLSGYVQGGNNPEYDNIRYFNAISDGVKRNTFLQELIKWDFFNTFWDDNDIRLPIYFGLHFVKILSSSDTDLGISSPNCFHQDGEPFTFAHLVSKTNNATGGINYVGKTAIRNKSLGEVSEKDIIQEFELKQFMDSFAVHDPKVSHYVSPLLKSCGNEQEDAKRCIILLDFSPTVQKI